MLLWVVVCVGFVASALIYHFWQSITWEEALTLFIASSLTFSVLLHRIYDEATTDRYMVSGYVTSLIHRPPFSYQCGKHTCNERERWIVEQLSHKPTRNISMKRPIYGNDISENCDGECYFKYSAPFSQPNYPSGLDSSHAYPILVSSQKFYRTKVGETSTIWRPYFNPVKISDEVTYMDASEKDIPYFGLDDYNRSHRLISNNKTITDEYNIELMNSNLAASNISIGLIITPDELYFEKLKRAWHQGKANDFVIVVNSPDGKAIRNVNILGWNNYTLRENVSQAIMGLPAVNIHDIIQTTSDTIIKTGPPFMQADLSKYTFLDVKIPQRYYTRVIAFQIIYFIYMMMLFKYNPNTKTKKLTASQVLKTWDKHSHCPGNWLLHPFSSVGWLLYIAIPVIVAGAMV